jgi:transcriptional regulator with XRE-family HTH domain
MEQEREDAVRRAMKAASGSLRALADEAGVSESLLRHIRDGRRRATSAVVEALAQALERRAAREVEVAAALRATLNEEAT